MNRRKVLSSLLLPFALVMTLASGVPSAIAEEFDDTTPEVSGGGTSAAELVIEGEEPSVEDDIPALAEEDTEVSEDTADDASETEFEEEASEDPETFEDDALLTVQAITPTVSYENKKNTTTVKVSITNLTDIMSAGFADSITVKAALKYQGTETRLVEKTMKLADIDQTTNSFDMNFENFGKFFVSAQFLKSGKSVNTLAEEVVGVTADQYNIAPLTATMPVTMFSLSLWGDECIRDLGPTMVTLTRAAAYDWDYLPQAEGDRYGVYGLPYIPDADLRYQHTESGYFYGKMMPAVAAYIHDLYEVSPDSIFNIYVGDNFIFLVHGLVYANKLPEDNYTLTVLSDGSGSYTATFAEFYKGQSDPAAYHQTLVKEWNDAKAAAYQNGEPASGFEFSNSNYNPDRKYVWPCVDSEPHASWRLTRPALLVYNSSDETHKNFANSVANDPKVSTKTFNIGNKLKALQAEGDTAVSGFRSLYNFNDDYFAEATETGKDVMMFLGTRVDLEKGANAFPPYARFVMEYYGDSYVYYYKGHPASPTEMNPSKQDDLDALGITDVNASIAAELILFFNPEIYLSGYASSTYQSVPVGMGKGMFNMTKAAGTSNVLYQNMDFWMTQVSDSTPAKAKELCTEGHDNYLVEFADKVIADEGYDIAIWDNTDSIIIYYKKNDDGSYSKVGSAGSGMKGETSLKPGVYFIQSELKNDLVLDVPGSSKKSGANVHMWTYKGANNQKWKISYDEDGMATITNVASGLALDVQRGSSKNGANIEQYTPKQNAAQKWNIRRNNDGTYTLYSAVGENVCADVSRSSTANRTNVALWASKGSNNQKWRFIPVDPKVSTKGMADIEEGCYTLSPANALKMNLDIRGWSTSNSASAILWTASGTANQVFRIKKDNSGFYTIENAFSGKVLDVSRAGYVSGTNVIQYTGKGSENQEWAIVKKLDNNYTIQNVKTGLMLNPEGGRTSSGTNVNGYRATNAKSQRWHLIKVADPMASASTYLEENGNAVSKGVFVIRMKAKSKAVLDVAGASKKSGANVALWEYKNTDNQKWTISLDKDGFATITNKNSGLALTYAKSVSGGNVCQTSKNGAPNQKWIVERSGDGSYSLVPALGDEIALTSKDNKTANKTNVELGKAGNKSGQKLVLDPAK